MGRLSAVVPEINSDPGVGSTPRVRLWWTGIAIRVHDQQDDVRARHERDYATDPDQAEVAR